MPKYSAYDEATKLKSTDLLLSAIDNGDTTFTTKKIQNINLKGQWDLLKRITFVSGTPVSTGKYIQVQNAQTDYTISSLTGNSALRYLVIVNLQYNSIGGTIHLQLNADSNSSNYWGRYQSYWGNSTAGYYNSGSGPCPGLLINPGVGGDTGYRDISWAEIVCPSGSHRPCFANHVNMHPNTYDIYNDQIITRWRNSADEITSMVVHASSTGALSVGSYIEIYEHF